MHAAIAIRVCVLNTTGTPSRVAEPNGRLAFGTKKDRYCEKRMQPEAMDRGAMRGGGVCGKKKKSVREESEGSRGGWRAARKRGVPGGRGTRRRGRAFFLRRD